MKIIIMMSQILILAGHFCIMLYFKYDRNIEIERVSKIITEKNLQTDKLYSVMVKVNEGLIEYSPKIDSLLNHSVCFK